MKRVAFAVVAVLFVGPVALADGKKEDKDKPKLSGTWAREVEGFEVKFQFVKDEEMKIHVTNGANGCVVKAKYTVDKDGLVKGTVTDVEEKGEFPAKPPKGFEFEFKFKIDGKKAKLSDFKGENADGAKNIIEGDYDQKKDD
jgi:hypothetical protein